jgi:DNA-binding transcriptional regulator GbsR (MarR family)
MNKLNMTQMLVNAIDQALNDDALKDKITEEDRNNITPAKDNLETLLKEFQNAENKEDAMSKIEEAQKALEDAWNPVAQKIYPQANAQGAGANPFGGNTNNPFGDMFNNAQQ